MEKSHKQLKRKDNNNERGRTTLRYRAYPTTEQLELGARIDGCCRLVKNLAKEQRDFAYRYHVKVPKYTDFTKNLKELRNDPNIAPFLKEAPAQVLQQALMDRDRSYKNFFNRKAKYPDWARKSGWISFRVPQHVNVSRISNRFAEVKLTGIGWIKIRMHRPMIGTKICSATYVQEPDGKVFISLLVERHNRQPTKPRIANRAIGVDRGGVIAAATYDGIESNLLNFTPLTSGEQKRLKTLERSRESKKRIRKTNGGKYKSQNEKKIDRKIAVLYGKKRRRSKDFVEQVSNILAENHSLVVFENLHIKSMTTSAKGTIDNPGKNVSQKAGMNKSFLSKCPAALLSRTTVKVLRYGHQCIEVPAPTTSITCSQCGCVDANNRAVRDIFTCSKCGYTAHADINAAIVIRERGIKLVSAGGTPVAAHQGTNLEQVTVQSQRLRRRGSGNKTTDYITNRVLA